MKYILNPDFHLNYLLINYLIQWATAQWSRKTQENTSNSVRCIPARSVTQFYMKRFKSRFDTFTEKPNVDKLILLNR